MMEVERLKKLRKTRQERSARGTRPLHEILAEGGPEVPPPHRLQPQHTNTGGRTPSRTKHGAANGEDQTHKHHRDPSSSHQPANGGSPGKKNHHHGGSPSHREQLQQNLHIADLLKEGDPRKIAQEAHITLEYVTKLEKKVELIEEEHRMIYDELGSASLEKELLSAVLEEQESRTRLLMAEAVLRNAILEEAHRVAVKSAVSNPFSKSEMKGQAIVTTTAQAYVNNDLKEILHKQSEANKSRHLDVQKGLHSVETQMRALETGMAARSAADAKLYSNEVSELSFRVSRLVNELEDKFHEISMGRGGSSSKRRSSSNVAGNRKQASAMMAPPEEEDDSEDEKNWGEEESGLSEFHKISAELRAFKTDVAALLGKSEGALSAQLRSTKSELINELGFLAPPKGQTLGQTTASTETSPQSVVLDAGVLNKMSLDFKNVVQQEQQQTLKMVENLMEMKAKQQEEGEEKAQEASRDVEKFRESTTATIQDMQRESIEWRKTIHSAIFEIQNALQKTNEIFADHHTNTTDAVSKLEGHAKDILSMKDSLAAQNTNSSSNLISSPPRLAGPAPGFSGSGGPDQSLAVIQEQLGKLLLAEQQRASGTSKASPASQQDVLLANNNLNQVWRHFERMAEAASEYSVRKTGLLFESSSAIAHSAAETLPQRHKSTTAAHFFPEQTQQQHQSHSHSPHNESSMHNNNSSKTFSVTDTSTSKSVLDKYSGFEKPYVPPQGVRHHQPVKLMSMAELRAKSGVDASGHITPDVTPVKGSPAVQSKQASPQRHHQNAHHGHQQEHLPSHIPNIVIKNEQSVIFSEHQPGQDPIEDPLFTIDESRPLNSLAAGGGEQHLSPPREPGPFPGEETIRDSATKRRVSSSNIIVPFSTVPVDVMTPTSAMAGSPAMPNFTTAGGSTIQSSNASLSAEYYQPPAAVLAAPTQQHPASEHTSAPGAQHGAEKLSLYQQYLQQQQQQQETHHASSPPAAVAQPVEQPLPSLLSQDSYTAARQNTQPYEGQPSSQHQHHHSSPQQQQQLHEASPSMPMSNDSLQIPNLSSYSFPAESFSVAHGGSASPNNRNAGDDDELSSDALGKSVSDASSSSLSIDDDDDEESSSSEGSPKRGSSIKKKKSGGKNKKRSDNSSDISLSSNDSLNQLIMGGSSSKKKEEKRKERVKSKNKGLWATTDVTAAKKQGELRKATEATSNTLFTASKKKEEIKEKERRKSHQAPDVVDLNSTTNSSKGGSSSGKKSKHVRRSSFDESDDEDEEENAKSVSPSRSVSATPTAGESDLVVQSLSFAMDPSRLTPTSSLGTVPTGGTKTTTTVASSTGGPGAGGSSSPALSPKAKAPAKVSIFAQLRGAGTSSATSSVANSPDKFSLPSSTTKASASAAKDNSDVFFTPISASKETVDQEWKPIKSTKSSSSKKSSSKRELPAF